MGNENLKDFKTNGNQINKKTYESKKNEVKYPKRMKDKIEKEKKKESSTSQNESETDEEKNQERIPFIFEWKEDNKKVTLTGDFFNWVHFIPMKKDKKTNFFKLKINLPKKRNEFKFIADGKWKCSNDYPQFTNETGIYNYIDLSNNEKKKEENKEKETKKIKKDDLNYNCYKPLKTEMNVDAQDLPRYFSHYNIDYNTRQNQIGNKKLLIYKENNLLSENNSYKKILTCPHVNLSHCCTQVNKDNNANIITSITFRFQHKFLTIIYYKPEFI
jgi:hypothetical protein